MSTDTFLDPQLAAAFRLAAELQQLVGTPGPGVNGMRIHAEQARRWWNEGGPTMARELQVKIPVGRRELDAVVYVPREEIEPAPAYVYLHGGGFRIGSPRSNDRMLRELAAQWGGVVLSLDYVHVPEHVFPEAVEDTAAVYAWIADHGAAWGIDGKRLAFGGSSAGASVALGAAIHLGPDRAAFLSAGALLVGTYSNDLDTESARSFGGPGFAPTQAAAISSLEQYVPDAAQRNDPRVDCVNADLAGMPPLFLAAAAIDVFRDSSRQLARAMHLQGRRCVLIEYEGMAHLFGGYTRLVDTARRCVGDVAAFLTSELPA
ncbi:alpha/beta hydrolase fold domain-containing protein [soil metagenome]